MRKKLVLGGLILAFGLSIVKAGKWVIEKRRQGLEELGLDKE